jgi:tetratricopeptide (TPR) repeat protein
MSASLVAFAEIATRRADYVLDPLWSLIENALEDANRSCHLPTNHEKVAQENYTRAKCLLDEGNKKEGIEALLKAAKLGHSNAQLKLGNNFLCSNDQEQAKYWLIQAAKAGLTAAMYNLGVMYRKEGKYQLAASYFNKVAETGDWRALYNMAKLYAHGLGIPKDMTKALELLKKASYYRKEFNLIGIDIDKIVHGLEIEIAKKQLEDAANVLVGISDSPNVVLRPSVDQNKGRWTDEENKRFLDACDIFILPDPRKPISWKKVSEYVGSRNPTQCRSHWQKIMAKIWKDRELL